MQQTLGLDTRMLQHTGIGTYLRGLLDGFRSANLQKSLNLTLFGSTTFSVWPRHDFNAPIYSIQEQLSYPRVLRQCRLWHAPHYNIPLAKGKTKLIVTIHDIIHWIFRDRFFSPLQSFYSGYMLRKAVTLADQLITVSHHTKKDLVKYFQADEKKITVIYESAGEEYHELTPEQLTPAFTALRVKYNLPDSFFLYVGLLKPHKNVLWLLRIFRKLKQLGKIQTPLVMIGRKDKRYPSGFEELQTLSSTPDILYLPKVDYNEILTIYNQALALIHPSLYEGFGLTLLEAMRCGTPVLTTNASSIPEVVGDAACRVDAHLESEMMQAIMRLEKDSAWRESLRLKGLARSQLFSWKETAKQTAAVYEKVLSAN